LEKLNREELLKALSHCKNVIDGNLYKNAIQSAIQLVAEFCPVDGVVIKTERTNTISCNDRAKRWAMMNFDKWNEVTGFVDPHISYYDEITALIEDAVEFGFGVAHGQPLKEIMKVIKKSEGSL